MIIFYDKKDPCLTLKITDNFHESDYKLIKKITRELFIGGENIQEKYRKKKDKIYILNFDIFCVTDAKFIYIMKFLNFIRKNEKELNEYLVELNIYNDKNNCDFMKDISDNFLKVYTPPIKINFNYVEDEPKWK
jgi:hypothetical protein